MLRIEFQGVDVGDRWEALADIVEDCIGEQVVPFTDVHQMMAFAAAGRSQAAERLLAALTPEPRLLRRHLRV